MPYRTPVKSEVCAVVLDPFPPEWRLSAPQPFVDQEWVHVESGRRLPINVSFPRGFWKFNANTELASKYRSLVVRELKREDFRAIERDIVESVTEMGVALSARWRDMLARETIEALAASWQR